MYTETDLLIHLIENFHKTENLYNGFLVSMLNSMVHKFKARDYSELEADKFIDYFSGDVKTSNDVLIFMSDLLVDIKKRQELIYDKFC